MTRGKVFEQINDTPENIAKALFRNDRLRWEAREAKAKNTEGKTVKVVVVDTGDKNEVTE